MRKVAPSASPFVREKRWLKNAMFSQLHLSFVVGAYSFEAIRCLAQLGPKLVQVLRHTIARDDI
jgi:hypothetical protein